MAIALFAVGAVVSPPAAAQARRPSRRPRLLAGLGSRASGGLPLSRQVLAGSTEIWVTGVRGPLRAVLTLDRKPSRRVTPIGRLHARRGALAPLELDTTKLEDGRHVLYAKVSRRRGRPLMLRAAFRVENGGAGSDQLIAQALAQHRIDYGTSLLYRFYALWEPTRLPAALRGSPSTDDTIGIDAAAAIARGEVKGKEAARLKPFLLRPTDPRSPFYVAAGRSGAHTSASSGCGKSSARVGAEVGTGDARVWAWQNSVDKSWPGAYRWVQRLASADLAREEADMGAANPDGPPDCGRANPTDAIDVYLVDGATTSVARDPRYTAANNAYAVTVPSCTKSGCSAFILFDIRATGTGRDLVDSILTHELYHVLQNAKVSSPVNLSYNWFTEASATWAQGHYEPGNPAAAWYSNAWYQHFQRDVPIKFISLLCAEDTTCPYQYWIWPFFMSQEGVSIAGAWDALSHVYGNPAVTETLDKVFPFATHFRDFAVRDLNVDYHEQGSGTPGPRFQTGAGGWPAISAISPFRSAMPVTISDTKDKDQTFASVAPGSLDFTEQEFKLPEKNQVRHVELSFTGLAPGTDVDVLVHVAGQSDLERRRLSAPEFDFCRDKAGDDIDRVVAVFSNHTLAGENAADAQMHYRASSSCGAVTEWKGSYTARDTESSGNEDWEFSGNADYVLDPAHSTPNVWRYTMDPTTPMSVSVTGHDAACTWSGSGTVTADALAELVVEEPHAADAQYSADAVTSDTIPVHYVCEEEEEFTLDRLPSGDFGTGAGPFSIETTELDGSWDSGTIQGGTHRYSTWRLSAAATGDAP